LPAGDRKFHLDIAIGFGTKVQIELLTNCAYGTVTGQVYGDATEVQQRDLTELYRTLHELRAKHPPAAKLVTESPTDAGEPTQVKWAGIFRCAKLDIFTNGEIESQAPFIISNRIGTLEYPSQSEADLAFCTLLAIEHGDDAEKIDDAVRQSQLMRPKWERQDYREKTIAKAIASAEKVKPQCPIF
jgi:hypothetical protein